MKKKYCNYCQRYMQEELLTKRTRYTMICESCKMRSATRADDKFHVKNKAEINGKEV